VIWALASCCMGRLVIWRVMLPEKKFLCPI